MDCDGYIAADGPEVVGNRLYQKIEGRTSKMLWRVARSPRQSSTF